MLFTMIVVLLALAGGVAAIYYLLRSMGNEGIEAAAPGSCKSGRCGVVPKPPTSQIVGEIPERDLRVVAMTDPEGKPPLVDEIRRPDARSPHQTL